MKDFIKNTYPVLLGIFMLVSLFISLLYTANKNYVALEHENQELESENKLLKSKLEVSESNYTYIKDSYINQSNLYQTTLDDVKEKNDSIVSFYKKTLSKVRTFNYSEEEINLLAKCVQAEAGSYKGHEESQKLVCKVILNRVLSPDFPDTIKDVIYQKTYGIPQFSSAYDGAIDKQKVTTETLNNVYEVLLFGYDLPLDVQYFYSAKLTESNWIRNLKVYDTVQGTVFSYNERR